eukprot:5085191-Amphidinium_carterae.1
MSSSFSAPISTVSAQRPDSAIFLALGRACLFHLDPSQESTRSSQKPHKCNPRANADQAPDMNDLILDLSDYVPLSQESHA